MAAAAMGRVAASVTAPAAIAKSPGTAHSTASASRLAVIVSSRTLSCLLGSPRSLKKLRRVEFSSRHCCSSRDVAVARAGLQPEAGTEEKQESSSSSGGDGNERSAGKNGSAASSPSTSFVPNELNDAVRKTAATFAPRASTASKNPAPPGSTLYKVFEAQAYAMMVVGGALSFNLIFPSDQPDIWRLMGMWSIWMFTVPSLRARDCSKNEKEALNYLFLVIPVMNVMIPLVWKSFAAVWSADVLAFLAIYAWKMEWLSKGNKLEDS